MKKDTHPEYFQTKVKCACGHEVETGSTKKDIKVEICSNCHPFFTGKQKLIDTAGRIERFRQKYANFQQTAQAATATATATATTATAVTATAAAA